MTDCFKLKIITDFAAAHNLRGYPGDCANLHGHNWKVEVEVTATELDELGMGVDFKQIKRDTKEVIKHLDHSYLNEVSPFDKINSTAENIAKYLYQTLTEKINKEAVAVSAVVVHETDSSSVKYTQEI